MRREAHDEEVTLYRLHPFRADSTGGWYLTPAPLKTLEEWKKYCAEREAQGEQRYSPWAALERFDQRQYDKGRCKLFMWEVTTGSGCPNHETAFEHARRTNSIPDARMK